MAMQTKVKANPHHEVFQEHYIYFSEQYSIPSKIEKLIECLLCFELSGLEIFPLLLHKLHCFYCNVSSFLTSPSCVEIFCKE